jgi:hypothetical protein
VLALALGGFAVAWGLFSLLLEFRSPGGRLLDRSTRTCTPGVAEPAAR